MAKVTIVVRARNEEFWMGKLLSQVKKQRFRDYEVVLVDNSSTDHTKDVFSQVMPDSRIVEIEDFKPGKAINMGIRAGDAPYAVILSAHCVPADDVWLENFVRTMDDEQVGAAYGRQLPLPTSNPLDRRDLLNTFGIERRIQKKDTFFHNANSIIRRDVWESVCFDETTPHIEDRLWAAQILGTGRYIVYEPDAAVYHYHGINHHDNIQRASAISDILTRHTMPGGDKLPEFMLPEASATLYCFLGHDDTTHARLTELLQRMPETCPVGKIFVHSKSVQRPGSPVDAVLDATEDSHLTFVEILKKILYRAHSLGWFPDCVVYINLRAQAVSSEHINESVRVFYHGMYDSVFFADQEYGNVWQKIGDSYQQLLPDYSPREKRDPIYISRYGLGLTTRPEFIENGQLVGRRVAIAAL